MNASSPRDATTPTTNAQENPEKRNQLGSLLQQIYRSRIGSAEQLAFLRVQFETAPKKYRNTYAMQLFDLLLAQPWTQPLEDDSLTMLTQLSDAKTAAQRLSVELPQLYRLTDRMVKARYEALVATIEDPEKLERKELAEKKLALQKQAQTEFADRLTRAAQQHDAPLADWLTIEKLTLDVHLDRDLDAVVDACWKSLGERPQKIELDEDAKPEERLTAFHESLLRRRYLMMVVNLTAREQADPQLAPRLLAYVDAGIALDEKGYAWKSLKYQLLIALDRPDDLTRELRAWIKLDEFTAPWRLSLARLVAERGNIPEAITLFESVKRDNELGPAEYATLAAWYMVVDRREDHDSARIEVLATTDEWRLRNVLRDARRRWEKSGELPSEVDANVLLAIRVLLKKSTSPQNYFYEIGRLYRASRDFRLLEPLPDAALGQTTGTSYAYLNGMKSSIISEVRKEATSDEILKRVTDLREKAQTPTDLRALDLLEMLVERRASEVLNQPGPHVQSALAAMQRAFEREWSDGEPRLMAQFLAGLGRISQQPLAEEQLRELRVLFGRVRPGTFDRLDIGRSLGTTLWISDRQDDALALLESALDEYLNGLAGGWPQQGNQTLSTYCDDLERIGLYSRAETAYKHYLAKPANAQQRYYLAERLDSLYQNALGSNGRVSLGGGATLYKNLHRRILGEIETSDNNHRRNLITRLCSVFQTARDVFAPNDRDPAALKQVRTDLRNFAFGKLPAIVARHSNNYDSIVSTLANTMHNVVGPRDALELLIVQIETEPRWLRYVGKNGWRRNGNRLEDWRVEVGATLGDLEDRLLAVVLNALRKDLENHSSRYRYMYHWHRNDEFWNEKAGDFARVAEDAYAKQKDSGAAVRYIAEYLYHGLRRYNRAIEIMFIADREKLLDESAQWRLVDFLHMRNRHGESIDILESLVEKRPENISYRVYLMRAYYRTDRQQQLLALLQATDEHFHTQKLWTESNIAAVARVCLDTSLYEQSAAYYDEVIKLHERTHANRGIGNRVFANYHSDLARVWSALGDTRKSVDAAAGGIVAWGSRHEDRKRAVETLRQVLRDSKSLDAYVTWLNEETDRLQQERPIIRKAIGEVYLESSKYDRALTQLSLALEYQSDDAETQQKLLTCYTKLEDVEGAVKHLLAMAALRPRDIDIYKDLGDRLKGRDKDQERAYTSIVEMQPNESESHSMLAEIRQRRNQWDQAIDHWQRVAEIRALEPTGLLRLGKAQLHEKQHAAARRTIDKLRGTQWPARFDKQVADGIAAFETQLREAGVD